MLAEIQKDTRDIAVLQEETKRLSEVLSKQKDEVENGFQSCCRRTQNVESRCIESFEKIREEVKLLHSEVQNSHRIAKALQSENEILKKSIESRCIESFEKIREEVKLLHSEVQNSHRIAKALQSENEILKKSIETLQKEMRVLTPELDVLQTETKKQTEKITQIFESKKQVRKEQIIEFRCPFSGRNFAADIVLTTEIISGIHVWIAKQVQSSSHVLAYDGTSVCTEKNNAPICNGYKFISNRPLYYIVVANTMLKEYDAAVPFKSLGRTLDNLFHGHHEVTVPQRVKEALTTKEMHEIRMFRFEPLKFISIDTFNPAIFKPEIYFMPEDQESTLVLGEV